MSSYDYRRPEALEAPAPVEAQAPTSDIAWGNAFSADLLGLSGSGPLADTAIAIGEWMSDLFGEEEAEVAQTGIAEAAAPFLADPCAEPSLFPIDPAQREAEGLPPAGEYPEECRVPEASAAPGYEAKSADVLAQEEADREREARGEDRGRSRGGGGDSIRWRTQNPNHPSPYAPPMQWRAPVR